MSESPPPNPLVTIVNTLICCGALACLITGIVFLANGDPSMKVTGTILTAVGGTIIGLQLLLVVCLVCGACVVGGIALNENTV